MNVASQRTFDSDDTILDGKPCSSVATNQGDHPIKNLLRQGYINYKGERKLVAVAEWENSLVLVENARFDGEIAFGLQSRDYDLVKAFDEDDLTVPAPAYLCRWCKLGRSSRFAGLRHEQKCSVEGAPGHVCVRCVCSAVCPGPSEWSRPLDGRIGNKKADRPRNKK